MTNNWFANFYGVVHNPPEDNLVVKAAFAEFGKTWFVQNKVAERIENGKRLYEHLCSDKEARELYDSLVTGVTGVALMKEAKDSVKPERYTSEGSLVGAGIGGGYAACRSR